MKRRILLLSAAAAITFVAAGPSVAASVNCPPNSGHPICKANYAAYPRGTLKEGQRSTGTATIDGKTVNWLCLGGTSSSPRICSY